LFQTHTFGPAQPCLALNFNLFVTELKNNFRTIDPKGKVEVELKALHMHEKSSGYNFFIKFQQLAT